MTQETAPHLDHRELNVAVIDAADIAPERRAHLNACERCRGEVERLRGELTALGRLAADLSPRQCARSTYRLHRRDKDSGDPTGGRLRLPQR